jgi:two-component system response regulator YesN
MGYSVVIVDDEPDIVNGLRKLVKRLSPECTVVGVAYDGEEGIQKIQSSNPEIVLTDIRMSGMDGIGMIRQLKEMGCQAKFVILTGFAEFSYAKNAIKLGVEDYITKPIEEDELRAILQKIINCLDESHRNILHTEQLEGHIKNIREYELKQFLDSQETDLNEVKQRMERFGFIMDAYGYGCILLEMTLTKLDSGKDFAREIIFYLLPRIEKKYDSFCKKAKPDVPAPTVPAQSFWLFPYQKNMVVVAIAFGDKKQALDWQAFWERIRRDLEAHFELWVCVGLSEFHKKSHQIREAFEEAKAALNYKVIKGLSGLIDYADVKQFKGVGVTVSKEHLQRLEESMDAMDNEGCKLVILDIFRELEKENELSLTDLQLISLDLILAGIRKIPFLRMQLNAYLGKNILSLDSIAKFKTMEQLRNWIINILVSMNELMLKDLIPERKDVISAAIEYMNKNFSKGITLKELADRNYLNPYYFSHLFKKKTGQTYQNYLMGIRVSRAKKLLEKTDLKLHEICEMVGYRDLDHFGKVFERIEGIKMGDYRKRLELQQGEQL